MVEKATRKAWVLASDEILEELQKDWSRPVQARASENPDGSWDMTFRTYADDLRSKLSLAEDLLRRLSEWDMLFERADGSRPEGLGYVADGPYWKREIERVRTALKAGNNA